MNFLLFIFIKYQLNKNSFQLPPGNLNYVLNPSKSILFNIFVMEYLVIQAWFRFLIRIKVLKWVELFSTALRTLPIISNKPIYF